MEEAGVSIPQEYEEEDDNKDVMKRIKNASNQRNRGRENSSS